MLSKESEGTILITAVYWEPLGSMTTADAQAEGYATVAEYRAEWERINGPGSWDPDKWVWVVNFEYIGGD